MNAQDLKSSILQRAIKGKLVPQRKEEGTAKELLAEIRAEKARLIKEKKIKKSKPLPEITDEEKPFDIPDSWEWVRWGDISQSIQYGYNAPAKKSGRIKMIRISDIHDNQVDWSSVPYCDINENEIGQYLLKENDILFARTGGTVGKSFLVKEVPEEAIFAGYLIRTRYSENLSPLYLKYFMESRIYWEQLHNGTIKTAQPNCNGKTLSKMMLPLPPMAEQHRIVAKIEELLPDLDAYDKAQTKLQAIEQRFPDAMKKSLLQYAIEGKLMPQRKEEGTAKELLAEIRAEKARLVKEKKIKKSKPLPEITDAEKPFDIPDSWEWVRLGNLVAVLGGKRIPAGCKLTEIDTGHKYIRVSDMKNGSVVLSSIQYISEDIYQKIRKYTISENDIYITVAGTIGRIGTIPHELNNANLTENADKLVIYKMEKKFLCLALQSPFIQSQIKSVTTKVGQPKLAIKRIENFIVPVPPLMEQHRIVAKIGELLPLCQQLAANP